MRGFSLAIFFLKISFDVSFRQSCAFVAMKVSISHRHVRASVGLWYVVYLPVKEPVFLPVESEDTSTPYCPF